MHPVRTVLAPGTAGADSLASRLAGLNSTETDWHQHRRGAGVVENHPVPASKDAGLSRVGHPVNIRQCQAGTTRQPHIKTRRHTEFSWIDAHQPPAKLMDDALAEMPNGRNRGSGADLHDHDPPTVRQ